MASVFISYRHVEPDQSVARTLHRYLADLDHDVFLDTSDIPVGAFWDTEIRDNVAKAEWFVPLVSLPYLHSPYILQHELAPAARLLKAGKIKGILQVNLAYDGDPPEDVCEVITQVQFLKWRGERDTPGIIHEIGKRIPAAQTIVKGMKAFGTTDGERFLRLGREEDVSMCLRLIHAVSSGLVLLHGVSGAGKTSFIKAGLLPRLRESREVRTVVYAVADTDPRQAALMHLGVGPPWSWEALNRHAGAVIFLDQFEQWLIHLAGKDEAQQAAFAQDLTQWVQTRPPVTLVFCLRDEYRTAFDVMLAPISNTCHHFTLLPFRHDVATTVLTELLTNVQVEFDDVFVRQLCEELAEGVPPTVRPALLQLIAQSCRHRGVPLNKGVWEGRQRLGRTLFEAHITETVLEQLPRHFSRLNVTRSLTALTAGEVKTTPKTITEIAEEHKLDHTTVHRTLDMATMPHARIVVTEADAATASPRFQLIHDLFAPAIQALHRAAERRKQRWRRRVLMTIGIVAMVLAVASIMVIQGIVRQRERRAQVDRLVSVAQELIRSGQYSRACKLLEQAREILPAAPEVLGAFEDVVSTFDLQVEPSTAQIYLSYWDSQKRSFFPDRSAACYADDNTAASGANSQPVWSTLKPGQKLLRGGYVIRIEQDGYLIRELSLTLTQKEHKLQITLIHVPSLKLPPGVEVRKGRLFRVQDDAELVHIPASEFYMGSDHEDVRRSPRPVHKVTLSAYLIDKYEITLARWGSCLTTGACHWDQKDDNDGSLPVEGVSWEEAYAYVAWINGLSTEDTPSYVKGKWALPTEAQWEHAAQPAFGGFYPWGPDEDRTRCNGLGRQDGFRERAPVGSFPQGMSKWGVHDLIGNVWEYIWDWYVSYEAETSSDPTGPISGKKRVYRGGAWNNVPSFCTLADRFSMEPSDSSGLRGFRLAIYFPPTLANDYQ